MRSIYFKTFSILALSLLAVSCGKKKSTADQNAVAPVQPGYYYSLNGMGYNVNGSGQANYSNTACLGNDNGNCVAYYQSLGDWDASNCTLFNICPRAGSIGSMFWVQQPAYNLGNVSLRGYTMKISNDDRAFEVRVGSDQFSVGDHANSVTHFINGDGPMYVGQIIDGNKNYHIQMHDLILKLCLDANRQPIQCTQL